MNRLVFNTNAVPQQKRFLAYRDELFRWSCGLDLEAADPSAFHAELEIYRAGAIDIMSNTMSAIETSRTPQLVKDGDDSLLVMLLLKGRAGQTQLGENAQLYPGDAIICDSAYPGSFNLLTDSRMVSLKIPRMMLSARLPKAPRLAGARLSHDPAALRLLSAYLAGSFDIDLENSLPATRLHQDHIINLVTLTLGAGGERHEAAEPGTQAVRRAAVIREIATSMADPAFDALRAAGRLGITVRYVHHLLEPTGKTFSEHLLDRRLTAAVELLRDTPQGFRKIADIALEVGFRDLSYFNRMFRRKYGGTPTDLRRLLLELHDRGQGAADT
jgi:AraC-like DNA-binding protein